MPARWAGRSWPSEVGIWNRDGSWPAYGWSCSPRTGASDRPRSRGALEVVADLVRQRARWRRLEPGVLALPLVLDRADVVELVLVLVLVLVVVVVVGGRPSVVSVGAGRGVTIARLPVDGQPARLDSADADIHGPRDRRLARGPRGRVRRRSLRPLEGRPAQVAFPADLGDRWGDRAPLRAAGHGPADRWTIVRVPRGRDHLGDIPVTPHQRRVRDADARQDAALDPRPVGRLEGSRLPGVRPVVRAVRARRPPARS